MPPNWKVGIVPHISGWYWILFSSPQLTLNPQNWKCPCLNLAGMSWASQWWLPDKVHKVKKQKNSNPYNSKPARKIALQLGAKVNWLKWSMDAIEAASTRQLYLYLTHACLSLAIYPYLLTQQFPYSFQLQVPDSLGRPRTISTRKQAGMRRLGHGILNRRFASRMVLVTWSPSRLLFAENTNQTET